MPLQNRVTPTGQIITDPARGLFMGNRGILHDDHQRLGPARWRHKAWIICALSFKDRRRELMTPGKYTELFFLDEAVALAAGHRPCAECRRTAYTAFRDAIGIARAPAIDTALHIARVTRQRQQVTHEAHASDLPDGSFIAYENAPHLVRGDHLVRFGPDGYGPKVNRPVGMVTVLTPAPTIDALRHGFRPHLHPSAG